MKLEHKTPIIPEPRKEEKMVTREVIREEVEKKGAEPKATVIDEDRERKYRNIDDSQKGCIEFLRIDDEGNGNYA